MEALRVEFWALICCPVLAWVGIWWVEEADIVGSNLRLFTFFVVVPAVLAAVGNAVIGQRGRALARASFWAVLVTIALFVPFTVLYALGLVGNADRSEAVARHEALLDAVPVYPGASYFGDWTQGAKEGSGPEGFGPITEYWTEREFTWDRSAPAKIDLFAWYWSRPPKQCEPKGTSFRAAAALVDPEKWINISFDCGSQSLSIEPTEERLTFRVSERD